MSIQVPDALQVLIIDDDIVDRLAVKRSLNKSYAQNHWQIFEAESCGDALAVAYARPFDCIFVDYRLPDGNGIDLIQTLRQSGLQTPLIALTGQGDEQVAVELMKAGACDYINKAKISPELLYRVIQQCLRLYHAEQEAERIRQQREALLAQREEFISRMTHDMQTPLVGANRMLTLIQETAFGDVPELVKDKLHIIARSNTDLLKMLKDLVEVYTYDIGAKVLNYLGFDLRELVDEVCQELEPLATGKPLTLQSTVTDHTLNYQIWADRLELKRVLINLVGNALKFTEAGEVTLTLQGSSPTQPLITITVQDTGTGISEADQGQLFERFRRGKHRRSNSGLGLYLSRQVIERHQGSIQVHSVVGQGTCFQVILPIKPPESSH
jgi:two-component system, sensor histidine kinase and response regulator